MKTFILFLFGRFDDHEDVEYFCTEVFTSSPHITSLRYVIEQSQNIIIIFDSESDSKTLSQELYILLANDNIKLYFLFERDTMVTAHLPNKVKEFIFKPMEKQTAEIANMLKLDYYKTDPILDLDELLDKIDKMGVDSLTPEEKDFLDNFDN